MEAPNPNKNRIFDPLRVKRTFKRSRPRCTGIMASDAGESEAAESVGDGSSLLFKGTTLVGIHRPKTLRRFRSFESRGIVMSHILQLASERKKKGFAQAVCFSWYDWRCIKRIECSSVVSRKEGMTMFKVGCI